MDTFKGILIFLVVLGHSAFPYINVIFWFHMPVFFMVSGYLRSHKEQANFTITKSVDKARVYFVPYFAYYILISTLVFVFGIAPVYWPEILTRLKNLLMGGTYLTGEYGIFWFMTSLYLARIFFSLIYTAKIKTAYKIVIFTIVYCAAIYLNNSGKPTYQIKNPWWDFRLTAICLSYYSLGFYIRRMVRYVERNIMFIASTIFISAFTLFNLLGSIDYNMNVKYGYHNGLFLNLLVPLGFFIILHKLSTVLSKKRIRVFENLGRESLAIMYLHIFLNILVMKYYKVGWITYTLIGIMLPLAFSWVVKKQKYLRVVFLGY